jgi:hypothetical protein
MIPNASEKYQVTAGGGHAPRWSRSGEIFWVDASQRLTVTAVVTTPEFRIGASETLFPVNQPEVTNPQYPVRAQSTPMTLVVNWHERLD